MPIQRARDRVTDEFEAFVRASFTDVWRYVRRRVASEADADDVTAEVFAAAWRRRDDAPPADERRLWLFGVARLTLNNHRRSGRRRDRLHLRLVTEAETVAPAADTDSGVWHALHSLDADDRDLLMMRAWDGLAVNDIAVVLGISANAVSQRLAKARTRLATALAAHQHTDPETTGHVAVDPTHTAHAERPTPTEETDHA
jgi:RNA polymerase sigma-70 factor (ECF subfamily)